MGVHGLWKLLEPAGKPVPLESLENKVLAVVALGLRKLSAFLKNLFTDKTDINTDVSIWLYQLTKGLQTTGGGAVPNAHLLGLFNRICKLLYYRIKPVFVFDGGVPLLKKETIEARKRQKRKAQDNSEQLREKLLNNFLKQKAVNQLLGEDDIPSTSQAVVDDMYALPPLPEKDEIEDDESDSDTEVTTAKLESFCDFQCGKDLHSIDINSDQFKQLPPEIRHDILSELIETKKQNSWAKIHEMPESSHDFSKFQFERLKKRREVQLSLEQAAKEMGGRSMTFSELEAMFKEDGIVTDSLPSQRIVSDNVTRFVYITGKSKEKDKTETENQSKPITDIENPPSKKSHPISESQFQKNMQTIDECIFIRDSSSDEEFDIDTNDTDYVRSLSKTEKISQEEILKIIKQEQNITEESSPSMVLSDKVDESVPVFDDLDDVEMIQPTQKVEKSRLSCLTSKISKYVNTRSNENTGSQELKFSPDENKPVDSPSIELFRDEDSVSQASQMKCDEMTKTVILQDSDDDSGQALPKSEQNEMIKTVILQESDNESNKPNEMIDTVILEDSDDECVSQPVQMNKRKEKAKTAISPNENQRNEHVSEAGSIELFSDTDSDDFIEVTNTSVKSSYFKEAEKQIEITIDPNKIVVDDLFADNDLFADIFDSPEMIDATCVQANNQPDKPTKSTDLLQENKPPSEPVQEKKLENKTAPESKSENVTKKEETQKNQMKTLADIFNKVKKAENTPKPTSYSPSKKAKPTEEQLTEVQKMLNEEQNELLAERGKQERLGSTITQQMIVEAQELLQLFGLPYVVAPMEAEAQCAFLDQISLTEGTITDDSDIWLFGGQKVYKNFFDNRKYVLQFRVVDIEHFFKLTREQLIQMALLVGSDYTVGIEGIGPVTALEILAYFSNASNKPKTEGDIAETLRTFRLWLKNSRNNASPLLRKCRNVSLSEAFPNTTVIGAYLYPTVDESKEGFTWATPDLDRIRLYMKSKFGWRSNRIDDILLPVMKRLNERNKQTTLDMYFKGKPFAAVDVGTVSKRVIQAINVMKNKNEEQPLPTPSTSKSPKKSPAKLNKTPTKRTRRTNKSTPLKKTDSRVPLPVLITNSQASTANKTASYFGEVIPQKEKDKMDAAKRKVAAIKIFQAQNKNKRGTKKRKVLPPKPDSSYLSESSDDNE